MPSAVCKERDSNSMDGTVTRMRGMKLKNHISLLLSAVLICSCADDMAFRKRAEVPEERIAALAAQIEDVVLYTPPYEPTRLDNESSQPVDEAEDIDSMKVMIGMDEIRQKIPALADLNLDNERVLAAVRGRVLRRPAIQEFEQSGCLGENRRGLLQYMGGKSCKGDRHFRDRASYIALNENRDRRIIYGHLVKANDLGSSAMTRIRTIFAHEIYVKAWAGTPLQRPDGTWERK